MCWSRCFPYAVVLALQLGLGWPLRRIRTPSQSSGPPAHVMAAGQRALPRLLHYYEPSDFSKGIGLLFPVWLWRRLPVLHRSVDQAIVDNWPPR